MSALSPQDVSESFTVDRCALRYAQLIYTSFDDGSGTGGGWQVKGETGDLTRAERQELTARIVTSFDVGEPLPTYPTPAEIKTRRARLVYAPLSAGTAGYWHTVDAGKDATGRPGNVFAHVLLDRETSAPSALRPIQLWGSTQWLRPYGAAEVAAATLAGEAAFEANEDMNAAAVVSFLTGTTFDRQSVFRVLLDAVHAALAGGPGVMLMTGELDSGPRWIAALSYFMSPGTARRFSWSTHDDAALARTDLGRGIHLVVVARNGAVDAPAGGWIAIDEDEEPSIGQLGSSHRTRAGAVTVTGWSVLAEGVLGDESSATRLIAQQDSIAAELGDHDLAPEWPLAVAVRHDQELSEFHTDADCVIADNAPRHAYDVEWIGAAVAAAVAATAPTTVPDAYDRFIRARRRDSGVGWAAQHLLQNILNDPDWILGSQLADLPVEPVVDIAPLWPEILAARDRLVAALDEVHSLRAQLRVIELLNRLGRTEADPSRQGADVSALISPDALNALTEAVVHPLVDDAAISLATRELILRPLVARQPAHVLDTLDPEVWRWLFDDPSGVPVIPPNPHAYDRVLLPRYVLRAVQDRHGLPLTTQAVSQLARDAIYLALDADELADGDCRELVTQLSVHTRLAGELADIFYRWPQRVQPGTALTALYYDSLPTDLIESIAGTTLPSDPDHWDRCAVACAQLRALHRAPRPWPAGRVEQVFRDCTSTVLDNLRLGHVGDLADEVVVTVAVLFTLGQSRADALCDIDKPVAQELRQSLSARVEEVVGLLADLVESQLIGVEWITAHALLRCVGRDLEPPTLLTDFTDHSDGRASWADAVVNGVVRRRVYTGPADVAALRDAAWPTVRGLSADQAERFFSGYHRVAREWLQDRNIGDHSQQRSGRRWTS